MVVLQLFNREKRAYRGILQKSTQSHMDAFKDAIMAHAVYYPVVEVLSAIAIACVIWFGGNDVIRSTATLGVLVAFMQYAQRFFRPIQDLSEKYNILQSAMASSERVFKLLDTPVEITSPAVTKKAAGPGPNRVRSRLVRLSQRARPRKNSDKPSTQRSRRRIRRRTSDWVLRDCQFTIEPAKRSPSSDTPAPARPRSSRC